MVKYLWNEIQEKKALAYSTYTKWYDITSVNYITTDPVFTFTANPNPVQNKQASGCKNHTHPHVKKHTKNIYIALNKTQFKMITLKIKKHFTWPLRCPQQIYVVEDKQLCAVTVNWPLNDLCNVMCMVRNYINVLQKTYIMYIVWNHSNAQSGSH